MEYHILLVDDEKAIHKLMSVFLAMNEKHAFTLHSARNGMTGVELYGKLAGDGLKPHLVLMDLRMPMMDGVEATKRIIEYDPEANVYLFTAYTRTEVEQDALKAGAKGTLNKAANWHMTVDYIITILESAGQGPERCAFERIRDMQLHCHVNTVSVRDKGVVHNAKIS